MPSYLVNYKDAHKASILFSAENDDEAVRTGLFHMRSCIDREPQLERWCMGPTGGVLLTHEAALKALKGVVPLGRPSEAVRRQPRASRGKSGTNPGRKTDLQEVLF